MNSRRPEFRYANLDTSEIEQLIGAGRGISLCAPTVRPIPRTIVLPLAGQPLLWRRALRWRADSTPQEEIDLIHQAFIDVYTQTIAENAAARPWWHTHPAAHPTVLPLWTTNAALTSPTPRIPAWTTSRADHGSFSRTRPLMLRRKRSSRNSVRKGWR